MCIFVLPAKVYGTKIAVAAYAHGTRQLLMYENVVRSTEQNTMILPVPAAAESIEFVDLSNVHDPWYQLEDATPRSPSYGGSGRDEYDLAEFAAHDEPPLQVVMVGGYRCSIAASIADLKRSKEIALPDGIERLLQEHYGSGYAFVICAFDADPTGATKMHPIAYTHALAGPGAALFMPTRHAHGDGSLLEPVPAQKEKPVPGSQSPTFTPSSPPPPHKGGGESAAKRVRVREDDGDDFDHTLYLINAKTMAPPSTYDSASNYNVTRCTNLGEMIAGHGIRCPVRSVQKIRISAASRAPNGDQWAE